MNKKPKQKSFSLKHSKNNFFYQPQLAMNNENQNIEYKESWRDEYLKWICGFANAHGGKLLVGINDKGEIRGVANAKKLIEDIPNKVRDVMGIFVEVNSHEQDDMTYIEIVVESYPYPINYHGHYYQRSGATNQELKGTALDRFMLRRLGKTWDGVPVPHLSMNSLDNETFTLFRKYAKLSQRMYEADLQDDNKGLLEKLRLFEGAYLKRAAVMLFHSDPEKFVTGAYIKIGFFREDADLVYQDEVHGNLFQQIRKTMELLTTKYMKAVITYEDIQRIETFPVPREALREALLNACINKDYADTSPIQIRVTDTTLQIVNGGFLPEGWTIDTLLSSHRSMPYNPDIANAFFRAGEIEAWGRGIERIIKACKNEGFSTVDFCYNECGLWTTFKYKYPERANDSLDFHTNTKDHTKDHTKDRYQLSAQQIEILKHLSMHPQATRKELADRITNSTLGGIIHNITRLKELGLLSREGGRKDGYWKVLVTTD